MFFTISDASANIDGLGEGWGCILSDMVQLRLAEIKFISFLGTKPLSPTLFLRPPAWWSDRLNGITTMASLRAGL